ncbi:MAG TPA: cell wall hydrolase [Pirellulales bacterium]
MQVAAFGAAAIVLFVTLTPSFAQTLQVADLPSQSQPALIGAEPLDANMGQARSQPLTQAILAAYVARQQAQKGFNIFGDAPQPQLTSAVVSAYAATHYRTNAALDAIDGAAAPLGMSFTTVAADVSPLQDPSSTVTDDMLENYAHHGYVPTERRVAHANDEKLCLSKAIYHEARGEADTGQWAVANVIINRALSKRFPTSMCGVVYQNADQGRYRCQFTFACDGQQDVIRERQAWSKANKIASAAFSEFQHGQRPGVVPGSALYYHTTSVSTNWGFKQVAQIGSHLFYSPM